MLHLRSRDQKAVGGKGGMAYLEQQFILLLKPWTACGESPPVSGKGDQRLNATSGFFQRVAFSASLSMDLCRVFNRSAVT